MRLAPCAEPAAASAGDVFIDSGDSNTLKWYDGSAWQTSGGGADSDWTISGSDMYSAVSGNVGIGTTNPDTFKLQVEGTIGAQSTDAVMIGNVTNMYQMNQDLSDADASLRFRHGD